MDAEAPAAHGNSSHVLSEVQPGERAFRISPVPHISARVMRNPWRAYSFHFPAPYPFTPSHTSGVGETSELLDRVVFFSDGAAEATSLMDEP